MVNGVPRAARRGRRTDAVRGRPSHGPFEASSLDSVSGLETRTKEWIDGDPDPRTRAELTALLSNGETTQLAERMNGTLEFGTAGIRGVVEGGSNRMNRAVVVRTTAGLTAYLDRTTAPDERLVIVGRDARPSSAGFM